MIPTTNFYDTEISRLILGDNPFTGNSYIPHVHDRNEMLDYYTANTVVDALFEAEENGINTFMALADPFIFFSEAKKEKRALNTRKDKVIGALTNARKRRLEEL